MKTDAQVQQDVMDELQWEPAVDAAGIGVEVKDGVVTLAGRVASFAEKWHAEHAAQRVAGVKALAIEITVTLAGSSERSDADIARAAENALEWNTSGPEGSIKVMVENGWVTLSGEAQWDYQRVTAERTVRHIVGVRGVSNQMVVKPTVRSSTIKADIEATLQRSAKADAHHIFVEVHGDDVTLSGTVHNWSERDLARQSAWGTAGVRNVVDNIRITP